MGLGVILFILGNNDRKKSLYIFGTGANLENIFSIHD